MSTPMPQFHWVRKLVEEYETPLIRYAARMTGDFAKARDVVQDTFLRLCREPQAKIEPIAAQWLYRVCRNRVLDVQKKDDRMVATDFSKLQSSELERGTTRGEPDPANVVEADDESRKAVRLLCRLPEPQQEVIRLKLEHGLSYRQISEITGHSVSNVGYLLHAGFKTLRQQMKRNTSRLNGKQAKEHSSNNASSKGTK